MVGGCLELSAGVVSKFGEIATETTKTIAIAAILMLFFKGILLRKKRSNGLMGTVSTVSKRNSTLLTEGKKTRIPEKKNAATE